MALHPDFPSSPYAPLVPDQRWFPADEENQKGFEKHEPKTLADLTASFTEYTA